MKLHKEHIMFMIDRFEGHRHFQIALTDEGEKLFEDAGLEDVLKDRVIVPGKYIRVWEPYSESIFYEPEKFKNLAEVLNEARNLEHFGILKNYIDIIDELEISVSFDRNGKPSLYLVGATYTMPNLETVYWSREDAFNKMMNRYSLQLNETYDANEDSFEGFYNKMLKEGKGD